MKATLWLSDFDLWLMILKRRVSWECVQISIPWTLDYDIILNWRHIGIDTCCWINSRPTMNYRAMFKALLWRHRWRHQRQNTFYGVICGDLFIHDVEMNPSEIFWNFHNGSPFEVPHSSSNINGDMAIMKCVIFFAFMTQCFYISPKKLQASL